MIRSIPLVALIALLAAVPPAAAQNRAAETPTGPYLRSAATVMGDIVRIGDLVENDEWLLVN